MDTSIPLAERMRARTWEEYVGQDHIAGRDSILRRAVEKNEVPSMVFWGPPGSGKTTLARIISHMVDAEFVQFSAVSSGVKQVREVVEIARQRKHSSGKRTILFVDEVHRFSKSQQDAFLPHIENGTIIFIGATTENPSFEINSALLSRSRVFVLEALTEEHLVRLINDALIDKERGLGKYKIQFEKGVRELLAQLSNGDARVALNTLEFMVQSKKDDKAAQKKMTFTSQDIYDAMQKMPLLYDRAGDEHFNTISAYIKSMRAGAVDAALYYLARMVASGEDPLFIARRMVVFASEDVSSPTALVVANAVFQACHQVGLPECQENLAAGTVYMAQAKKDRSAYDAYMRALQDVRQFGNLPIPRSILNSPTNLMKELGYGSGYEKYPDKKELLLPDKLRTRKYFHQKPT